MKTKFQALADHFYETNDTGHFMHHASEWLRIYVQRYLNSDPDICGDFLLHFYEKLPTCMRTYKGRYTSPFYCFFVRYIKNEFRNFIRLRRLRLLPEISCEDMGVMTQHSKQSREDSDCSEILAECRRLLHYLPPKIGLPLRLYYGIDIDDAASLAEFKRKLGTARACLLIREYTQRSFQRRIRDVQLRQRVEYLDFRIQSADRLGLEPADIDRCRRWKRQIACRLQRHCSLFTLTEIGAIFGISKSTVYRRIRKAQHTMRSNLQKKAA